MYEVTFHNVSRSNESWTEKLRSCEGAPIENAVAQRELFDRKKAIRAAYDRHTMEGVITADKLIVGRYTAKRIA